MYVTLKCVLFDDNNNNKLQSGERKKKKLQMWTQTQHLKKPKEIDGNPIIKIFALIIR
jgi:hypothetical protein